MPYETSWKEDLRTFAVASKEHWKEIVGGSLVFLLIGVAASLGLNLPPVITGVSTLCFAVALACFLCWRDEHAKTLTINRRATLYKIRDLIADTKTSSLDDKYDSFGALLRYSEELRTEEDVVWVCSQLREKGHDHPFGLLELTSKNALAGHWLNFLQEARASSLTIKRIPPVFQFAAKQWSKKDTYLKGRAAYAEWEAANPYPDGITLVPRIDDDEREAESPEDVKNRICVKFARYMEAGRRMLRKVYDADAEAKAQQWAKEVEGGIWLAVGEVWQAKFRLPTDVPLPIDAPNPATFSNERAVYEFLFCRIQRLNQLIEKIEAGAVQLFPKPDLKSEGI